MKKIDKNKFAINSKSFSLSKINPYYENKEHYLPYRYKDPSFKTKYNGLLMQKDYYIINLMDKRLKKLPAYKRENKKDLPLIQSNPIEVSKKKDIIFNSTEFEKSKSIKEYSRYIINNLKRDFFKFNPYTTRSEMINYRNNNIKNNSTYNQNIKNNPKIFLMSFQKKIHENNYKNWDKIKEEYERKELNEPNKFDKYYDKDKIWEILNENKKRFIKSLNSNYSYEDNLFNRSHLKDGKSVTNFSKIRIGKYKSENRKKKISPSMKMMLRELIEK